MNIVTENLTPEALNVVNALMAVKNRYDEMVAEIHKDDKFVNGVHHARIAVSRQIAELAQSVSYIDREETHFISKYQAMCDLTDIADFIESMRFDIDFEVDCHLAISMALESVHRMMINVMNNGRVLTL